MGQRIKRQEMVEGTGGGRQEDCETWWEELVSEVSGKISAEEGPRDEAKEQTCEVTAGDPDQVVLQAGALGGLRASCGVDQWILDEAESLVEEALMEELRPPAEWRGGDAEGVAEEDDDLDGGGDEHEEHYEEDST